MEKVDMLLEPIRVVLAQIGAFLPGWRSLLPCCSWAGWWPEWRGSPWSRDCGPSISTSSPSVREPTDSCGRGIRSDTTDIFGALVYWLVLLATLVIAFNGLGLTNITDLLGQLLVFVPKLIVSLLILVLGAYFARFGAVCAMLLARTRDCRMPRCSARSRNAQSSPSSC